MSRFKRIINQFRMWSEMRGRVYRVEDYLDNKLIVSQCSWREVIRTWIVYSFDQMRGNVESDGWHALFWDVRSLPVWLFNYKDFGLKPYIGEFEIKLFDMHVRADGHTVTLW